VIFGKSPKFYSKFLLIFIEIGVNNNCAISRSSEVSNIKKNAIIFIL